MIEIGLSKEHNKNQLKNFSAKTQAANQKLLRIKGVKLCCIASLF
jgi:hypothetical protein